MFAGLRFAFGTLSVLRVRVSRWDRPTAGRAMLCAPLVGLVLGLLAAVPGAALDRLGGGPLLAAVACVAALGALTRGLHLDGLADVADGLGSNKPPAAALAVMKASDIGPFGVVVLLLVLLAQIASLARAFGVGAGAGAFAVLLAATAGRAALLLGCRVGTPSARPDGLGAMVAGTVRSRYAALVALAVLALLGAGGWAVGGLGGAGHGGWGARAALGALLAPLCGLACAAALLTRCVRRFGGITGDVLGAMVETSATAALLVWTLFAAS
ncbi:adenosylcobinamide-GDP ribazoletransferase [Streptacidiphilus sp. PB12-B1b]|uniref:adenosylcobinamide-GDP ribazoletransferase n=1 Tax=Streptacidiphilus sp. PB12-B1b TaxID=2705012 RepID=UPI0015F86969|nr:adenosylcobinamide-GDP ribazoletransferase [Streptacidiphilus sp. PB12-B1b]QMU75840.1 adenosylcobinamide-GDP ribazoletransferase [Streptacidiphilus sp. PB12-B1b]